MKIIIILGEKLKENGNMSLNLINRLDKGIEIYNKYQDKYQDKLIIVSGGRVQMSTDLSEAIQMKKYLINTYNIEKNKIIEDNLSQDTIENSKNCLKIIEKMKNISEIIVVSSEFHIKRVEHIFTYFFKNNKISITFIPSKNGISGKILQNTIKNEDVNLYLWKLSIQD